jgi:hypothetical protein
MRPLPPGQRKFRKSLTGLGPGEAYVIKVTSGRGKKVAFRRLLKPTKFHYGNWALRAAVVTKERHVFSMT